MCDKIYYFFRLQSGQPCVGATNVSFDQVDPWRAVFRQEGAGKVSSDFHRSALIVTFVLLSNYFLIDPSLSEINSTLQTKYIDRNVHPIYYQTISKVTR